MAAMELKGKVSTHHGDFLRLLPELRQDVVFLDPPWVRGIFVFGAAARAYADTYIHSYMHTCS